MTDAFVLTILGMATVLIVLFVISLMIRFLGNIVGNKVKSAPAAAAPAAKAAPAKAAAPAPAAAPADDTKVVAVITAAIAAYLGTSPCYLGVINVKPASVSSPWSTVGRLENTKKIY